MYRRISELTHKEMWAAGYVSTMGTISLVTGRQVRLTIRATRNQEAATQFARIVGLPISQTFNKDDGKRSLVRVQVAGAPLQKLMDTLWPGLTQERRYEYTKMVRANERRNQSLFKVATQIIEARDGTLIHEPGCECEKSGETGSNCQAVSMGLTTWEEILDGQG